MKQYTYEELKNLVGKDVWAHRCIYDNVRSIRSPEKYQVGIKRSARYSYGAFKHEGQIVSIFLLKYKKNGDLSKGGFRFYGNSRHSYMRCFENEFDCRMDFNNRIKPMLKLAINQAKFLSSTSDSNMDAIEAEHDQQFIKHVKERFKERDAGAAKK